MKNLPLFCVAALLGLAVSVPAQRISFEGQFGRSPRGVVVVDAGGGRSFGGHRDHCGDHRRPRGHWETVHEQVLVPGYWRDEHVPPTYGWIVDRCGHRHWGIVHPGGCHRIWVPARYETRCRQVWVSR
jgi:hypothetical protein